MENEIEQAMTRGIRRLLEKKQEHLEKMKDAGRKVEIYLAQLDIKNILTYAGL